jgi:hypothetical protein
VSRPQGETRELSVTLTPEELEDRGADLAAAVRNADQEEAHMEGRKAAWREELKGLKEDLHVARTEASKLAEIVRTGKERRDVDLTWKYAIPDGWAFLVRNDTGERVQSRKLKDEERQLTLGEPPYAEATPEELAEWLANLPVNEAEALPEGHADGVETGDRAVDLGNPEGGHDATLPGDLTDEELLGEGQLRWIGDDDIDPEPEDEGGDVCGLTMDHDVNPATNECRRCGAELAEEIVEQEIDDGIVTDEFGEPLDEPISAGATTPQPAGQSVHPPRVGPGETLLAEPAYVLRCSDCGAEEGEPFAGLDECPHCHIGRLLEMTPAEPLNLNPSLSELATMSDAQAEKLVKRSRAKR